MELGFAVSAGPLSQISVHLLSLENAVQLATGLWGWYKGPQSLQSLQQTLEARNAALVASQTFRRHRYTSFRNEHGCVYGAAFDTSHRLIRLPLPRASSANSDDAGVDCLRALIVGLSCFMEQGQIYSLLKDLIPQHLLHFGQDDDSHRLDGASLAATLQFISAVIREEYVDKIRDRLFDLIDSQLPRVTGASRAELLACQYTEVCHMAGVLRWILKPPYKFEGSCKPAYPTRSLKVWALALVLAELGFEVEASRVAVTSPYNDQGDQGPTAPSHESQLGIFEVSLVLTQGWPTDLGASESLFLADNSTLQKPARIVPIRAIPSLAYAEVATKIDISADLLQEAFITSFHHVQGYFRSLEWIALAAGLEPPGKEYAYDDARHKDLGFTAALKDVFATWTSPELRISKTALRATGHPRFLLKPLLAKYGTIEGRMNHEAIVQIMLLAWLLALVTLFVRQTGVEDPLDLGFTYCNLLTKKVYFPPETQPGSTLDLSGCDIQRTALYKHSGTAINLLATLATVCGVTGVTMAISIPVSAFRNYWQDLVVSTLTISDPGHAEFDIGMKIGVQRNGLTLVSDFIFNPSLRLSSMLVYHAQWGQLLDLPLKGEFVVSGEPSRPRGLSLKATEHIITSKTDIWAPPAVADWLRWDAEPCWESDVRRCGFTYRIGGISLFQIGIEELSDGIRDLGPHRILCNSHDRHETNQEYWNMMSSPSIDKLSQTTRANKTRMQAIRGQKWLQLPIIDMVKRGQLDVIDVERAKGSLTLVNWLVQVGENEMLAMLALISKFPDSVLPRRRIMTDCLAAGLEMAMREGYPNTTFMIIVLKRARWEGRKA